jgi:hypothetical protein
MPWAATTLTLSSNEVTGVSGTHTAYKFELVRNTGSLNEPIVSNVTNSTVFYDQTLTIILPKQGKNDTVNVNSLAQGRWIIFVMDANGNVFLMGHTTGAELTSGAKETGVATGDFNGYRLEFKAPEPLPAYHVQFDTDFDTTIEGLSVSPGTITAS